MAADKFPEPLSGMVVPRFGEVATFMRLPIERDPARLDIALIGVPWDGGTTNRAGARHGPREIRNMSSLMRMVHPTSRIAPFTLLQVASLAPPPSLPSASSFTPPGSEGSYPRLHAAGAVPLSAGGDHLITLPI